MKQIHGDSEEDSWNAKKLGHVFTFHLSPFGGSAEYIFESTCDGKI